MGTTLSIMADIGGHPAFQSIGTLTLLGLAGVLAARVHFLLAVAPNSRGGESDD